MKQFIRTIEDFECGHCGAQVKGDGYTNHCPLCLWSRHVDINPGDRRKKCGGMMRPSAIEKRGEEYVITQTCERCGFEWKNKIRKEDNFEAAVAISKLGI